MSESGETSDQRPWSIGRILAVVTILSMVVFWLWVLAGGPNSHSADYLHDRSYVRRVSGYCKSATAVRVKLPPAEATPKAADRADSVDKATAALTAMVDSIERDHSSDASDRHIVSLWVADWRIYLKDRREYTQRLRASPARARFLVEVKPHTNDSYDTVIGAFADANNIPECEPPTDLA